MLDLLLALAVLTGAAVQSATGFGFALVSGPALFAVLQPAEAVTALLVLGIAVNLLVLLGGRDGAVRWAEAGRLVLAALPGLAGGALLLGVVPKQVLQVVVGIGVLLAVGLQLRRPRRAGPPPPRGAGAAVGVLAGVLTTTTGTNGPPLVLWLERRRLGPADARRTISAVFLALNALGAVALAVAGRGGAAGRPVLLGVLLVAAVVGHLVGAAVFRRLDPRRFRIAGLVLCAAAGVAAIVSGVAG